MPHHIEVTYVFLLMLNSILISDKIAILRVILLITAWLDPLRDMRFA